MKGMTGMTGGGNTKYCLHRGASYMDNGLNWPQRVCHIIIFVTEI